MSLLPSIPSLPRSAITPSELHPWPICTLQRALVSLANLALFCSYYSSVGTRWGTFSRGHSGWPQHCSFPPLISSPFTPIFLKG